MRAGEGMYFCAIKGVSECSGPMGTNLGFDQRASKSM
jgi:hypothetical protein